MQYVVRSKDDYQYVIALHVAAVKDRYRQMRLRALGEVDDNPTYKTTRICQLFGPAK